MRRQRSTRFAADWARCFSVRRAITGAIAITPSSVAFSIAHSMTREITHMKSFSAALESLEKPPFSIGRLAVTPGLGDEYFNASTGDGDEGETDMKGPWQTSFGLHTVESQMNGGKGLSVGSIDGVAGYEARGKQDSGLKATTATKVKTVDTKSVPNNKDVQQTGRQATMIPDSLPEAEAHKTR